MRDARRDRRVRGGCWVKELRVLEAGESDVADSRCVERLFSARTMLRKNLKRYFIQGREIEGGSLVSAQIG